MAIFFKSESLRAAVTPALVTALTTDPKSIQNPNQVASEQANQVVQRVGGTFSWPRLTLAIGLLALIFVGAVYTGRDPALSQLYAVVVHGFEVGLGGVLGLLVGEAGARG